MILLTILAIILIIAGGSVTALAWILIGAEVEERRKRKKETTSVEAESKSLSKV